MKRINVLLALSILLFNASCSEEEDIVAPVVESEPEIEYEQPVADFTINVYSTEVVLSVEGEGGTDEIKQIIKVIDFRDLMVGNYTYISTIITDSGWEYEVPGTLSISKFSNELKIDLDNGQEVIYTDGWHRDALD